MVSNMDIHLIAFGIKKTRRWQAGKEIYLGERGTPHNDLYGGEGWGSTYKRYIFLNSYQLKDRISRS